MLKPFQAIVLELCSFRPAKNPSGTNHYATEIRIPFGRCLCYHLVSNVVGTESQEETSALMAGVKGRSGPPGNQNNFKHGLSWLAHRRTDGVLSEQEQSIRDEILSTNKRDPIQL
jgi:hypothetical protein